MITEEQNLKKSIDYCLDLLFKESMGYDSIKNMSESDFLGIKSVTKLVDSVEKFIHASVDHMVDQDNKLNKLLLEIDELKSQLNEAKES